MLLLPYARNALLDAKFAILVMSINVVPAMKDSIKNGLLHILAQHVIPTVLLVAAPV